MKRHTALTVHPHSFYAAIAGGLWRMPERMGRFTELKSQRRWRRIAQQKGRSVKYLT